MKEKCFAYAIPVSTLISRFLDTHSTCILIKADWNCVCILYSWYIVDLIVDFCLFIAIITANSSTDVALQTSTAVTSSPAASASVTIQSSMSVQVFQNVTNSSVPVASASVTVHASENATVSSPVASASVTSQAHQITTTSSIASASVQDSENATSSSVALTSNTVQASKRVASSSWTFAMQSSHNVTITVSPHPTTGISASVHFNRTSQPTTQVSPNASSVTSLTGMTSSLHSVAVLATTFTSQSVSKFSAPGMLLFLILEKRRH